MLFLVFKLKRYYKLYNIGMLLICRYILNKLANIIKIVGQ